MRANNHYLTPELKIFYSKAYQEVKDSDDPFWKLDEGLSTYLDKIDASVCIRSIYSKRGRYLTGLRPYSYLAFAYTREVELNLLNQIIPKFISKYNLNRNCVCDYRKIKPYLRKDKRGKNVLQLLCLVHPEYFNVHHVRLELIGGGVQNHDEFWAELSDTLSIINP